MSIKSIYRNSSLQTSQSRATLRNVIDIILSLSLSAEYPLNLTSFFYFSVFKLMKMANLRLYMLLSIYLFLSKQKHD